MDRYMDECTILGIGKNRLTYSIKKGGFLVQPLGKEAQNGVSAMIESSDSMIGRIFSNTPGWLTCWNCRVMSSVTIFTFCN